MLIHVLANKEKKAREVLLPFADYVAADKNIFLALFSAPLAVDSGQRSEVLWSK